MSNMDQIIRERAYHLWEADGRPHGRDDEFWERARELVGMEMNPDAGQLPNPMNHTDRIGPQGEPIEEAEIMDNLGEFPGRFVDQGETRLTPAVKKTAVRAAPKKATAQAAPAKVEPKKTAAKPPAKKP